MFVSLNLTVVLVPNLPEGHLDGKLGRPNVYASRYWHSQLLTNGRRSNHLNGEFADPELWLLTLVWA
jgi:hypothetical protein